MPPLLLLCPWADGDRGFPPAWEVLPRVSASIKLKPPWSPPLKPACPSTIPAWPVSRGPLGTAVSGPFGLMLGTVHGKPPHCREPLAAACPNPCTPTQELQQHGGSRAAAARAAWPDTPAVTHPRHGAAGVGPPCSPHGAVPSLVRAGAPPEPLQHTAQDVCGYYCHYLHFLCFR